jgi:uncharacterized protein (DUF1697 family)
MPATYLALLRGVNVGGKNRLPMKSLVEIFARAGCENVRTYIQSGNVLFNADPGAVERLPGLIASRITDSFGYKTPVVLRTASQLCQIVANNPFLEAGVAEDALHVMFLVDQPAPECVGTLDPQRSQPDAFVVRGQEIYLRYPNGLARSRLTNSYFDSRLATTSTARNWRTVTKLLELANGPADAV